MTISYYLNENRQKNLYCRISDGKERLTISLGRSITPKEWDDNEGMPKRSADIDLQWDLKDLKNHLEQKYHELKVNNKEEKILPLLKKEAIKLFNTEQEPGEEDWEGARVRLHDLKHAHPTENYLRAFLKFSGANKKDIKYKPIDGQILVLYKDTTYMISHMDDFKSLYRHYFEKESYGELFTQTPDELWDYFLTDLNLFEADELITEIYRQWRIYWMKKRDDIAGGEERYQRFRTESFQDLQVLFQAIQANPSNVMKSVSSINDIDLKPLIAMAIYDNYDSKEKFYEECADFLIENGEDFLTDGDTFESICLDDDDNNSDEWYFIYNPLFEFND